MQSFVHSQINAGIDGEIARDRCSEGGESEIWSGEIYKETANESDLYDSPTGTQSSDGMNKWLKRGAEQVCSIAANICACHMRVTGACLDVDLHMH